MPAVQIQNVPPDEIPDEMTRSSRRFAPIEQNCNPPVIHPPVADPAAQAAILARGWRAWAAEGGVP